MTVILDIATINSRLLEECESRVELISRNEAMRHCLELARSAAKTNAPVMITGETGVGKSLLALAIHQASARSDLPCVHFDCATVNPEDMKQVLFGGDDDGDGLLDKVRSGTLVIESVDLLSASVQQELFSHFTRPKPADRGMRIVSTSSTELTQKAANGFFLQELMYCLGEVTIRIPPLRNRLEDFPQMIDRAIQLANRTHSRTVNGLSRTAMDFIQRYAFPGNVRELYAIIGRAVRATRRETIYIEDLGLIVDPAERNPHYDSDSVLLPLHEMEKLHIAKVLLRTGWKTNAAARILAIPVAMLKRKIDVYNLDRQPFDGVEL